MFDFHRRVDWIREEIGRGRYTHLINRIHQSCSIYESHWDLILEIGSQTGQL